MILKVNRNDISLSKILPMVIEDYSSHSISLSKHFIDESDTTKVRISFDFAAEKIQDGTNDSTYLENTLDEVFSELLNILSK